MSARVLPSRIRRRSKSSLGKDTSTTGDTVLMTKPVSKDRRKWLASNLDNPKSGLAAKCAIFLNIFMIVLSVLNFFFNTMPDFDKEDVHIIESVCTTFFTIELVLRTYIATVSPRKMMLEDPTYWIDVLCVVPYYVELVYVAVDGPDAEIWAPLKFLQLLRLLRMIKLFRHYSAVRVLLLALQTSWRALLVPCFAMFMTICLLAGALWLVEDAVKGPPHPDDPDRFQDGFDAMWCLFWIVSTLGYDGYLGADHPPGKLIIAVAICAGVLFTTMPITIIGEAFRAAWEKKELLEVQMKIQDMLIDRELTVNELNQVFNEFDSSGDGTLDWGEFKAALKKLKIKVPVSKVRSLFAMFDEDETGEIDYHEFCRLLFPNMDELPALHPIDEGGDGADGDGGDGAAATSPGGEQISPMRACSGGSIPPPAKRAAGGGIPPPSRGRNQMNNARMLLQSTQALQGGGGGFGAVGLAALAQANSNNGGCGAFQGGLGGLAGAGGCAAGLGDGMATGAAAADCGASALPTAMGNGRPNLSAFLKNRAAAAPAAAQSGGQPLEEQHAAASGLTAAPAAADLFAAAPVWSGGKHEEAPSTSTLARAPAPA